MRSAISILALMILVIPKLVFAEEETPPPLGNIHMAAVQGDLAVIQQHIDAGSDLDEKDAYGSTPLLITIVFDKPDAAALLISAGADLEVVDSGGSTPLHAATFFGRTGIVELLLQGGADRFAINPTGSTAYDIAATAFDDDLPLYDKLSAALKPMGFSLDYEQVKAARIEIAEILKPRAIEYAGVDYTPVLGRDWSVSTPQEQGLSAALVAELYYNAAQQDTLYSLLIIKNGQLVAESYFNDGAIDQKALMQSATKSFYSALVGLAVEQGYIASLDQTLLEFFPEFTDQITDPRKAQITLRQMLQMRTGFPWEESDPALWAKFIEGDHLPLLTELPLCCDPGTEFHYSNFTTYLLGVVIERASGMKLGAFADEFLFGPLDIEVGTWWEDNLGYKYPIIHITARDVAKFGLAYLNGGIYDGHQVLPESWVRDSLVNYSKDDNVAGNLKTKRSGRYFADFGYGYQWWSASVDGYSFDFAAGHGGQLIILLPEHDMVLVVTSEPFFLQHDGESWKNEQARYNLVGKFIRALLQE